MKSAPIPNGAPVDINIEEGNNVAQGIVMESEYDAGWLYRVEITSGDNCDVHREKKTRELWVCDFEIKPRLTS